MRLVATPPDGRMMGRRGLPPHRIVVTGAYERSAAYPNVIGRLSDIERDPRLDVIELHYRVQTRLVYANRVALAVSALSAVFSIGVASVRACLALYRHRGRDAAYLPYPAVGVAFLSSFLPSRAKPGRVVVDAFISLYDTVVIDRGLLSSTGLLARLLARIERRAFRGVSAVIVDTSENAERYGTLLDVERDRFVAMPLALASGVLTRGGSVPYRSRPDRPLRLLFVGTMVPLHGIGTLCAMIESLQESRTAVDVHLIGDGQESGLVERLGRRLAASGEPGATGPTLRWCREWQAEDAVVREIREADLCIGVLGTADKADRVWPYKNYLYMREGRALLTARTRAATALARSSGERCFLDAPGGEAESFAAVVRHLVHDRAELAAVGAAARRCYERHLSGEHVQEHLLRVLCGRGEHPEHVVPCS